jgi:RNA-binding protein
MITNIKIKELKKQSKVLDPIIRIGKNGLTANVLKEIENHLKKNKLIKIRVLKSVSSNSSLEVLIMKIMKNCESCILIDKIGSTFTLYKISSDI